MNAETESSRWPLPVRIAVLIVLLAYLLIMVWAPLTTPIGAPYLTDKVEEFISPVQHALFLRHGYRFFGPDPGPTHSLVYEIELEDGSKVEGHFPDREKTSPRLLYHRWFMVSETLYREAVQLPPETEIQEVMNQFNSRIAEFEKEGKTEASRLLAEEREAEFLRISEAKKRWESLLSASARVVLKRYIQSQETPVSPSSIRLWIQSREQPRAEESLAGMELTDPILWSRVEVGFFNADELLASPEGAVNDPTLESGAERISPMDSTEGASDE